MNKTITQKKYLKNNERCREVVKKAGLDYLTQYSYNGPKVSRTKFWGVGFIKNKPHIKKTVNALNDLSFVDKAVFEDIRSGYCGCRSIRVFYKQ